MSSIDTNQASEELQEKVQDICDRVGAGLLPPTGAGAIMNLIRTEKLKLLAEVRERVIGEDLPLNTTPDTGQRIYNKVKADEREQLTKLEAEL